ncbi:hypothetical protein K7X08_009554 [Anisodus acutangulus]|uniref:Uncharacterized protein n=1 Tax=Anisodus acutangulus TaxID=402998 RepID=A0A9Q1N366_9SOLA|nr:hypothetical protein K7X08_009554 [Anisodus acutangulus]
MAIITRFLLGLLNGLIGPIRAYAAEVFRAEYQAMGMPTASLPSPQRNIRPHSQRILYLGDFSTSCLAYAYHYFPWSWVLLHFWLPETLHNHDSRMPPKSSYKALEAASDTKEGNESTPKESLFKNWPLMSAIILYCVFSLHDMAYSEVIPYLLTQIKLL